MWVVDVWLVVGYGWVVVGVWVDVVWGNVGGGDCRLLSLWVVVYDNCWVNV